MDKDFRMYTLNTFFQRSVCVLAAAVFACVGGVFAAEKGDVMPEKRGPTVISGIPWEPVGPDDPPKAVYGVDDRLDVYEETDPDRLAWAASTCAVVDVDQLDDNGDGTYELDVSAYRFRGAEACEGEPFADQPTAPYCTAFVVGGDLLATAGHCVDEYALEYTRFVFGFVMEDAATAVTTFTADQVYTGVEIVGQRYAGDYDFAIVRVDRLIEAPGAGVFDIRRSGTVAAGTRVGVIGHPAGLPLKIAFGDDTRVRSSWNEGYFMTNVDSFGGNSGSPVINAETGVVEGILVFGEEDFELQGDCFVAAVYDIDGGEGEGASRSTTFAEYVRSGLGQVVLDQERYGCSDVLEVRLADMDLDGTGTVEVVVATDGGDTELLTVLQIGMAGSFRGSIPVTQGVPLVGDGILEVSEWDTITATYSDADAGEGVPGLATATALVDCTPPVISNITVDSVGGHRAAIAFETNEPCVGRVRAGTVCGSITIEASGDPGMSHLVRVSGLDPSTPYSFSVEAEDLAGNTAVDDDQGACYTFTTTEWRDYFTELLDGPSDLVGTSVTFTPSGDGSGYEACSEAADGFPTCPTGGKSFHLEFDDYKEYVFEDGKTFTFYGIEYDSMFVGSNGYITFGEGDTEYRIEEMYHFRLPRISGFFTDLEPYLLPPVRVRQLDDRVAVTYEDMPDWWGDYHSFQIELLFDGAIRISWVQLTYPWGIVGLSDGGGIPSDFEHSDLSEYATCETPYSDVEECGRRRGLVCMPGVVVPPSGPFDGIGGDAAIVGLACLVLAVSRGSKRADGPCFTCKRGV